MCQRIVCNLDWEILAFFKFYVSSIISFFLIEDNKITFRGGVRNISFIQAWKNTFKLLHTQQTYIIFHRIYEIHKYVQIVDKLTFQDIVYKYT